MNYSVSPLQEIISHGSDLYQGGDMRNGQILADCVSEAFKTRTGSPATPNKPSVQIRTSGCWAGSRQPCLRQGLRDSSCWGPREYGARPLLTVGNMGR